MRAAFGLVGLLVTMGVIIMLMKIYHPADPVIKGAPVKEQAQQWAGVNEEGVKVRDTIRYSPQEAGGRFRGLLIDEMTPNSPMRTFYHLKRDDIIVEAMEMSFKDYSFDEAKAFVETAYQRNGRLIIMRNGQRLRLTPTEDGLVQEVIGGQVVAEQPEEAAPEQPAPQGGSGSALSRQLEGITK